MSVRAAADLANRQRFADKGFKRLAGELRLSQRALKDSVVSAVDEAARETAMARMRRAAGTILHGGLPNTVSVEAVVKAGAGTAKRRTTASAKLCLVIGDDSAGLGWGVERLGGGTQTTAVVAKATGRTKPFTDAGGELLTGGVDAVPAGRRFDLGREDLLAPKTLPLAEAFVDKRLSLLRPGGRHVLITESYALAESLKQTAPRPDARIWVTDFVTFRGTKQITRYAIVIAKPRPTTMVKLASLVAKDYPEALIQQHLTYLRGDMALLKRKLEKVWATKLELANGEIPLGHLNNLTGNIAEIFAKDKKNAVLQAIRATSGGAGAFLASGVKRIDGVRGHVVEFTDDMVVKLNANGHLEVLHVFEVKAGKRGGQEATAQVFGSIENELNELDRIVVNGKQYVYHPGSGKSQQVLKLTTAPRTIITANGAETMGRMSDMVRGHVSTARYGLVHNGQALTAAQIKVLARRIIESLP